MNKISELEKNTDASNETTTSVSSTATMTTSTISTTSTTKLETKNTTSEADFGSISLKSTSLTISNLTENSITPNETANAGNMSDIIDDMPENKKVQYSELKNCPWITWFAIAFCFIVICCKFFHIKLFSLISTMNEVVLGIIKCVSKYLNKRNARKADGIEPSDEIKSRIREAAIASASSHCVRKPLIQSPSEIHKSIKTTTGTSPPKPRSKSPAKYPSKTL